MTQNIEIFARNMEVTDRIDDYVRKKTSRLDRKFGKIEEMRVDLAYAKSARNANDRQVAQITIRGRGFILRSEERADDIFSAIDASVDKMQRQIERYKGKRRRGRGETLPETNLVMDEVEDEITAETPVIARRKQFTLIPMDELEAVEQMSLLGHENFFIFYNANTSKINVLYRRRDDTFGLIEPSIG